MLHYRFINDLLLTLHYPTSAEANSSLPGSNDPLYSPAVQNLVNVDTSDENSTLTPECVKPAGFGDCHINRYPGHKVFSRSSISPQGHNQLKQHPYQKHRQTEQLTQPVCLEVMLLIGDRETAC